MPRKNMSTPKRGKKTTSPKKEPVEEEEETMAKIEQYMEETNGLTSVMRIEVINGVNCYYRSCVYCSADDVKDLVSHIKVNHKGKPWVGIRSLCPIDGCGKTVVDIQNHMRNVHNKIKNFSCNQCSQLFISQARLQAHVNGVHMKLRKDCPHCGTSVKAPYLEQHIRKMHGKVKPRIDCSAGCGKSYTCKADMDRHYLRKHLNYKMKCEFCDKQLAPDEMGRHVKKDHHGIFSHYCKFCQAGFNYDRSLSFHINSVHTGLQFSCKMLTETKTGACGKTFRTEYGVIEHIKKHFEKDHKVECGICKASVYSCYLSEHSLEHSKEKIPCDLEGCSEMLSRREEMFKHFHEVHPVLMENLEWCQQCNKPVFQHSVHVKSFHEECEWSDRELLPVYGVSLGRMCEEEGCKLFFQSKNALNRHISKFHNKPTRVKCDICGKLIRNVEQHHRDYHAAEKVHTCDVCGKGFHALDKLRIHKRVHTKSKEMCDICSEEYTNLKQHVESVHQMIKKYACEVKGCTTKFNSSYALMKHQLHVHEGLRYKCELCNKKVASLKSHIKLVHEKVRAHTCPECKKGFQTTAHLKNHISRVHLKVRDKCPDCGKEVQDLRNHQYFVHLKQRNYPCDQCDTRCFTSSGLRLHIQSVHLGERHKCPDCGGKFVRGFMNRHRKNCFASSSYAKSQCTICLKRFVTEAKLTRHVEIYHEGMMKLKDEV